MTTNEVEPNKLLIELQNIEVGGYPLKNLISAEHMKGILEVVTAHTTQAVERAVSNTIVLVCPNRSCNVAIVSSRELSRYQGTGEITDPPHATSCWLPCEKHYEEGAVPFYCDKDGNEISADPHTWLNNTKNKELDDELF